MRYLSSISLAVIVHVLLSIGILTALACTATPATPAPTLVAPPVLTETLVAGLVESYEREGASHWREGQNLNLLPTPVEGSRDPYRMLDPEHARVAAHNEKVMASRGETKYLGWNCISSGRHEELVFRGSYWELMVSGNNCDGVEIFRIEDSYDGTVKRVRP